MTNLIKIGQLQTIKKKGQKYHQSQGKHTALFMDGAAF